MSPLSSARWCCRKWYEARFSCDKHASANLILEEVFTCSPFFTNLQTDIDIRLAPARALQRLHCRRPRSISSATVTTIDSREELTRPSAASLLYRPATQHQHSLQHQRALFSELVFTIVHSPASAPSGTATNSYDRPTCHAAHIAVTKKPVGVFAKLRFGIKVRDLTSEHSWSAQFGGQVALFPAATKHSSTSEAQLFPIVPLRSTP